MDMGPEEELKQINKAIKQYETVLRATTDSGQRERVANELRKLKKYKAKIEAINIIDKGKLVENKSSDEYEDFPFLKGFLSEEDERSISDREVFYMSLYMNFFESERDEIEARFQVFHGEGFFLSSISGPHQKIERSHGGIYQNRRGDFQGGHRRGDEEEDIQDEEESLYRAR